MKKNRVTLLLSDKPYKFLRIMAASENISMSKIVEEFVMGDRQIVSDEKQIKEYEDKLDIEPDDSTEEIFDIDKKGKVIKKK